MEMPKDIRKADPLPNSGPDVAHVGSEHADVKAVNAAEGRSLYADRQWVYPKLTHGFYRNLKWALMAVTLGLYYVVPWIRWNRGPDLPGQAVILDMQHERFFMFGLEIWPQEFYYVTGLLILASLTLFLVTALAGRVWCGYFCPQTVWTDLMVTIERFWQGDRNARIRLDKEPWGPAKIFKKVMTHLSWIALAIATGGAFVFYFADAPTLLRQLLNGTAPTTAYMFIAIFAGTTYVLGGIAREQVCIYMCPWPRIQGAMIDKDSFLVSYRDHRGEPRGPIRKSEAPGVKGDCIDCKACIAVCPMGIDIRDGAQLECIQCALCIDACDDIMHKVGRKDKLIGYTTLADLEAEGTGSSAKPKLVRSRTMLYFGLIAVVGLIMLGTLSMRNVLELNVLPERNPFFVRLSDGSIRNTYTIKILNKLHEPRTFAVKLRNLPNARVAIAEGGAEAEAKITAPTDGIGETRVFVIVPEDKLGVLSADAHAFDLIVMDVKSGQESHRTTTFRRR